MSVSILVPNYNHAKLLTKALQAFSKQDYLPEEIIIVDDCSTDNSVDVIRAFQKQFKKLRLIQNTVRRGPLFCINHALRQARCEYVAFCASDDLIFPNFLKELASVLEKHPDLALCTSNFCFFRDLDPSQKVVRKLYHTTSLLLIDPNNLPKIIRKSGFWIPTSTSLYRRKNLLGKSVDDNLKSLSDWYLNYQIAFEHKIAYLPKNLSAFRMLDKSYSHSFLKDSKSRNECYRYLFSKLKLESKNVRKAFYFSGVLAQQGRCICMFLLFRPKYWYYLPAVILKVFRKILSKIKNS